MTENDGSEIHALRQKYKELALTCEEQKKELEIYQRFISRVRAKTGGLIVEFDDFYHQMGIRSSPSV